jgi:hypothetical protein
LTARFAVARYRLDRVRRSCGSTPSVLYAFDLLVLAEGEWVSKILTPPRFLNEDLWFLPERERVVVPTCAFYWSYLRVLLVLPEGRGSMGPT